MSAETSKQQTSKFGRQDMNANTNSKHGRFSFLMEEWFFQLALVVAVVGALVERGIALSGGTIV
jgi:hypothetical protein